jgi:hypothetical protein
MPRPFLRAAGCAGVRPKAIGKVAGTRSRAAGLGGATDPSLPRAGPVATARSKGHHGDNGDGTKPLCGSPSHGRLREAPVTRKPLDRLWDAVEDRA